MNILAKEEKPKNQELTPEKKEEQFVQEDSFPDETPLKGPPDFEFDGIEFKNDDDESIPTELIVISEKVGFYNFGELNGFPVHTSNA